MCGIAGILSTSSRPRRDDLEAMSSTLNHRGPDDSGSWIDDDSGIALAHRRLSIIDLSEAGHQPMHSADGRYVLVFNGEIYNFHRIRSELEKELPNIGWRGGSDTEVLLSAISQWGLQEALAKVDGMYALGLWDRQRRELSLARDRIGEKPLYIGRVRDGLIFSSELTAFGQHGDWRGSIDHDAIASFLRFSYIRGPQTVFSQALKLPPSHILTIDIEGAASASLDDLLRDRLRCYWSLSDVALSGSLDPLQGDEASVLERVEDELLTSVRDRMIADVPLGAFLSGGVDSSLVVALMQRVSARPVKTFTMGFDEPAFDEAPHANAVAHHLGTDHTELYVTGEDALDMVPRMATVYDEPFADASQIPTLLLTQLTRRSVTVALSGDGGDELFYGYGRYANAERLWRYLGRVPYFLRRGMAQAVFWIPPRIWDAVGKTGRPLGRGIPELGHKLYRFATRASAAGFDEFYANMLSVWPGGDAVVLGQNSDRVGPALPDLRGFQSRMMFRDQTDYLPDDVLVKVDRASMAVSLEVRVPLLARRVVELAWSIPPHMRWRGQQEKWLLRTLLYRHVPREIVDRPKQGFGPPLAHWLRGPLREWAQDLLSEDRLSRQGLLDTSAVQRLLKAHLNGNADHGYPLWAVLMLQNWLDGR